MLICILEDLVICMKEEHILNLFPSPDNVYENIYTHMYFFLIAEIVRGDFTA